MDGDRSGKRRCFISHSYQDAAALEACVAERLPNDWEPFVFPPQTVSPDKAISGVLIDELRACEGFVYLDTPASGGSFWVAFERNIAARLEKEVYAFRQRWLRSSFARDRSVPADPLISVLFNLCVERDVERIAAIRELIWDRYRFEIRGDKWRHLDNDARQMFDSIDGLAEKRAAGGVALVFLSNASVCDGHHDYVDPYTYRRAIKDGETPIGYTAAKFAGLDPERTIVIWLEAPAFLRIEAALARFAPAAWGPYVDLVAASLHDPCKLVVGRPDGSLDLNHLDTMMARCFWAALQVDPMFAASFRTSLARPLR